MTDPGRLSPNTASPLGGKFSAQGGRVCISRTKPPGSQRFQHGLSELGAGGRVFAYGQVTAVQGLLQSLSSLGTADMAQQHGGGLQDAGRVGIGPMPRSIIRGAEPWMASNMA